jgi:pimeloyl-ACP methyl ester carboxylesterase
VARPLLVLLHGAGTDPRAFTNWSEHFPDHDVRAPDLQQGLNVAEASMQDYRQAAHLALNSSDEKGAVLCGWSMGGLVALMAADHPAVRCVIVIEPSLPVELAGQDPDVVPMPGTFHPDDLYGASPQGPPTRTESRLALQERQRGLSVPAVRAPLLVIAGRSFPRTRGSAVAEHYGGTMRLFPHLHHAALVGDPAPRSAIRAWLNDPS